MPRLVDTPLRRYLWSPVDPVPTLEEIKNWAMLWALRKSNGDVRAAARALDIGYSTMYRWLTETGRRRVRGEAARARRDSTDLIIREELRKYHATVIGDKSGLKILRVAEASRVSCSRVYEYLRRRKIEEKLWPSGLMR